MESNNDEALKDHISLVQSVVTVLTSLATSTKVEESVRYEKKKVCTRENGKAELGFLQTFDSADLPRCGVRAFESEHQPQQSNTFLSSDGVAAHSDSAYRLGADSQRVA